MVYISYKHGIEILKCFERIIHFSMKVRTVYSLSPNPPCWPKDEEMISQETM